LTNLAFRTILLSLRERDILVGCLVITQFINVKRKISIIGALMEDDHQQLASLISTLLKELDELPRTRVFELLDLFWARLAVHIRAENRCLFPALRKSFAESVHNSGHLPTFDEVDSTIETLRSDHNFFMDQLAKAVLMLRESQSQNLQSNASADARRIVAAVSQRLREHDRLEEEHVYKWTDAILTEVELTTLSIALRHELENMPPRFSDSSSAK